MDSRLTRSVFLPLAREVLSKWILQVLISLETMTVSLHRQNMKWYCRTLLCLEFPYRIKSKCTSCFPSSHAIHAPWPGQSSKWAILGLHIEWPKVHLLFLHANEETFQWKNHIKYCFYNFLERKWILFSVSRQFLQWSWLISSRGVPKQKKCLSIGPYKKDLANIKKLQLPDLTKREIPCYKLALELTLTSENSSLDN